MTKDFSSDLNDLKQVYVRATFLSYLVQKVPMIGFVMRQLIVLSIGAVMTYRN
jgi:ATP-binding cassette subfamily B protein